MKNTILIVLFSISISELFGQRWVEMMNDTAFNFFEVQAEFNSYWEGKTIEKGKGWKQFKRWEYFMQSRIDSNGRFTNFGSANQVYKDLTTSTSNNKAKGEAGNWKHLGPFGAPANTGAGRANCIAFHPTVATTMLVGSASGGIWRTVDGGLNWSTNTDEFENLGISDIKFALSDPNIVYAATGDGDGSDTYSYGIIKSSDGGLSWQTTGLTSTTNLKRLVHKIIVHPTDANTVYAATSFGLRKTDDGGSTWTQLRAGAFKDIAFKPGDPNTIYAVTGSVFIRSTNGGATWSTISISFASSPGRLVIATTEAEPNYVYLLAGKNSDNGFGGLYRSSDGGASFITMSTTPNLLGWSNSGSDSGGQAWYDLALTASQTNKDMIFVGGVNIWKSTNGGTTWSINAHWTGSGAPYVHADIHRLQFSPHSTSSIWACTDGGMHYSLNNGSAWGVRNTNLSIGQMYRMGGSASSATKVMTGWQDNGSNFYNTTWSRTLGGDGMECLIDYSNNSIMYGSLYYGQINRTINGGQDWTGITDNIGEEGAWVTPYVQDPNNSSTLYAGFLNVFKTTNKGNSWTQISNFTSGNTLQSIAVAPSNSNIIYTASNYNLYRTTNGGSSWTDITNLAWAGGVNFVTYIAVHPTNPLKILVTLSGYYAGQKVYQSIDGGSTWTNISGSLPNLPANTIVFDKNSSKEGIYVGMDVGVFYRDSTLNDWLTFINGLPNVIVKELEIFYPDNKLRAATYGRGLWESELYDLANIIHESKSKSDQKISIYPNPTSDVFTIDFSTLNDAKINLEIFSPSGQLIYSNIIVNRLAYDINLKDNPPGVYIVKASVNGKHEYLKIVLQ